MILERDERSEGWVAYEGMWNPQKFEFERLRACFKCPERGALDDGSWMGWFVNRAADGAEPDWGIATMRCFSHWEREWNVLLFFSLLVNVFSVIVKAYDLKLFADAMICFFSFLRSVIGNSPWSGMKQRFRSCYSASLFAKSMHHSPTLGSSSRWQNKAKYTSAFSHWLNGIIIFCILLLYSNVRVGKSLLCKQCSECAFCLWVCFVYQCS